jgi:hypothetical protein
MILQVKWIFILFVGQWRCPKMRVLSHPFWSDFPQKPSITWGSPIAQWTSSGVPIPLVDTSDGFAQDGVAKRGERGGILAQGILLGKGAGKKWQLWKP